MSHAKNIMLTPSVTNIAIILERTFFAVIAMEMLL